MGEQIVSRRHLLRIVAGAAALVALPLPARAGHARMTRLIEKAVALPSISQRVDFISRALIGTPYRSYMLIGGPRRPEQFVIRDDAFDCVTYCEAVLAAALARRAEDYPAALRQIRYHNGTVSWRARNHYFSQWCESNVANNLCQSVAVPGAATINKTLNYMPALGARRVSLNAVARADLLANKRLLATGDIIGFLSQRARLDYFHIGFVVVAADGELWLRHAAKSKHGVLDEPLARFLSVNRVKAVTLLRPREPEGALALI